MRNKTAAQFCAGAALGMLCSHIAGRAHAGHRVKSLLGSNYSVLSNSDRRLVGALVEAGHGYLFQNWPPAGRKDTDKRRLVQQAARSLSLDAEAIRAGLIDAPDAAKKPHTVTAPHGKSREDPYYWLRDDEREDPEVLEYLKAESQYTQTMMADTEDVQAELFKELRGRIQETDESVPVRRGNYFWYSRTEEGKQYSVHCRRLCSQDLGSPAVEDAMDLSMPEEVLIDANKEAEAHSFYMLGALEASHDNSLLAYAVDTTGNEKYTLYVKNIATGEQLLSRPIKDTGGGIAWSKDNSVLFYTTQDAVHRPDKVWRHVIGSNPDDDQIVFHETDPSFNVGVGTSRSKEYIFIETSAAVTSETLYLPARDPMSKFKVFLPRKNDVEYEIAEWHSYFFIKIRDSNRPNSELLIASIDSPEEQTVLESHDTSTMIEDFIVGQNFLVIFKRENAQQTATSYRLPSSQEAPKALQNGTQIRFDEAVYALWAGQQGDYNSNILRVVYSSLTTPATTIDQDLDSQRRVTKKVEPVLGGFESSAYHSERGWATASDKVKIPISLVYKKGLVKLDGSDPLLLDAYGSYGICNDPAFHRNLISLLDRGFVYAIAHVRGGGELGRQWYENGKFKHKRNTFTDFISAAEYLIDHKYTSSKRLCIEGRSAGGLTMGAVVNMRPDLFQAAIYGVPFVDVVTTMLDESIPLTTGEFEEWGNPANEDYYDYMLSYSPVDQIQKASYPHILILAGLHDPRVAYWEPAKFTAKLRDLKTDRNLLLLKCDMGAGHFSQSGRFDKLKDVALEFAFLLKALQMQRS